MSNQKKAATLGMPHGTANNRLRKIILFHLLKKYNENTCFKCSKAIEKIEDLSIEHKKPWEGISADLFWDIENIAFSHLKCNLPHSRPGGIGQVPKIGPEGTAWCSRHKKFLSVESFDRDCSRFNGYHNYCKHCRNFGLHPRSSTDRAADS